MTRLVKTVISGLMIVGLVASLGCNREEVFQVVEEDQIASYIENVEKARNLFRVDGIFPENEFQWPGSNAVYRDSILSTNRTIDIFIVDTTIDYSDDVSLSGWVREGVAHVVDEFSVRTFRVLDGDTSSFDETRTLIRNGFFFQLGTSGSSYSGWELWGVGPGDISKLNYYINIKASNGVQMRGDYDHFQERFRALTSFGAYIKLSDMEQLIDSVQLTVEATISNANITPRYKPSIIRSTTESYQTKPMLKIDLEHFVDTVSINKLNDPVYDLIVFRLATEQYRLFNRVWVIPYRALR